MNDHSPSCISRKGSLFLCDCDYKPPPDIVRCSARGHPFDYHEGECRLCVREETLLEVLDEMDRLAESGNGSYWMDLRGWVSAALAAVRGKAGV